MEQGLPRDEEQGDPVLTTVSQQGTDLCTQTGQRRAKAGTWHSGEVAPMWVALNSPKTRGPGGLLLSTLPPHMP